MYISNQKADREFIILVEDCESNMTTLINQALRGNPSYDCIPLPTVNTNMMTTTSAKPLARDMKWKRSKKSPEGLKATENSNYVYSCYILP